MRPSAQPFSWKWVLFAWEWKIISISKAEHLTSFDTEAPGNSEMAYSRAENSFKSDWDGKILRAMFKLFVSRAWLPPLTSRLLRCTAVLHQSRDKLSRWFCAFPFPLFQKTSTDKKLQAQTIRRKIISEIVFYHRLIIDWYSKSMCWSIFHFKNFLLGNWIAYKGHEHS